LPPRVDDNRFALAHDVVVPSPHRRLDGLAHCRHMLEAVMVFWRLIRASTSQGADRRRRGMKDIHVEFLGDPPRTPGVGIGR